MGRFEDDITSALRAGDRFERPDVAAARVAVAGRVARRARRRAALASGSSVLALGVVFVVSVFSSNVSPGGGDDPVAVSAPGMVEPDSAAPGPVVLSGTEAAPTGAGAPNGVAVPAAGDMDAAKQASDPVAPSALAEAPVQVAVELVPEQGPVSPGVGVDLRTDLVVGIEGAAVSAFSPNTAEVSVPTERGSVTVEVSTSGSFMSKPTGPVVSVVVDGVPVMLTVREVGADSGPAFDLGFAAATLDMLAGSLSFVRSTGP